MLLSPDESALLSLQETICSVVFSALTDPNVQLQLVGIRALTVLGSLQGWCLGRQRGGVALLWELWSAACAACGCTGGVAALLI